MCRILLCKLLKLHKNPLRVDNIDYRVYLNINIKNNNSNFCTTLMHSFEHPVDVDLELVKAPCGDLAWKGCCRSSRGQKRHVTAFTVKTSSWSMVT